MAVRRTLILVANEADASGGAPLDDLAGRGQRFDVVCRFVGAALLTSHGVRTDTTAIVLFTSAQPSRALRLRGDAVRGLSPDERSTAGVLNRALGPVVMPVWQSTLPGIDSRAVELGALLEEMPRPVILLTETGTDDVPPEGGTFVVGDHRGLNPEQEALVGDAAKAAVSLGPVPVQADQAAILLHNRLDLSSAR